MQSREVLEQAIKLAVERDVVPQLLAVVLQELDSEGITFENDEIDLRTLHNFVKDDEVFTDNADYSEGVDYAVYESDGKRIFDVDNYSNITGVKFSVPIESEEDKAALLELCDRLQRKAAIKYPKKG